MESTNEQSLTVNGKRLPEKDKKSSLISELAVEIEDLAVDAEGMATESSVLVKSCHVVKDGQETNVLKAGDKGRLVKGKDGKVVVTLNDQPATQDMSTALGFVLTAKNDDDRVYGPNHKVKVGETWPMDTEYGVADLNKEGLPATKGSLKGNMKLVSAHEMHGVPCLQLAGTTDIDMAGVPIPTGPPGMKAKRFEIHVKITCDLPVDKNLHRMGETIENNMVSEGEGSVEKNGQTITFSFVMEGHQKKEIAYTPR